MALVGMLVFLIMHLISIVGVDIDIIGTIISKIVMMVGVYLFSLIWGKEDKVKVLYCPSFCTNGKYLYCSKWILFKKQCEGNVVIHNNI